MSETPTPSAGLGKTRAAQCVVPTPAERAAGIRLLADGEQGDRRLLLVNQIQTAEASPTRSVDCGISQGGRLTGYVYGVPCSKDAVITLGPVVSSEVTEPGIAVAELMATYHARLTEQGVRFSQALRAPEDEADALHNNGYASLALLDYLFTDPDHHSFERETRRSDELARLESHTVPLGDGFLERFEDIVGETFEETEDCPRLSEFRTTREVVEGYLSAPSFNPECWLIAVHDNEPVGVLIATPQSALEALELTYLGVKKTYRGRGVARYLMYRTAALAKRLSLSQIVLAVDTRNRPANRLYAHFGFSSVMRERVWVRRLG